MWASTHVLSDEPGHAWQSSVLLGQLGTGCLRRLPSAPALPTAPSLGQQHYCCVDDMQQGSHHSSQGLFPCPQQSVTLFSSFFFGPNPCPACSCFSLHPPLHARTSSVVAETPSQKECMTYWVPWRRRQTLVKIVECNAKWWGFNSCAKCVRRQILQGKILSVI